MGAYDRMMFNSSPAAQLASNSGLHHQISSSNSHNAHMQNQAAQPSQDPHVPAIVHPGTQSISMNNHFPGQALFSFGQHHHHHHHHQHGPTATTELQPSSFIDAPSHHQLVAQFSQQSSALSSSHYGADGLTAANANQFITIMQHQQQQQQQQQQQHHHHQQQQQQQQQHPHYQDACNFTRSNLFQQQNNRLNSKAQQQHQPMNSQLQVDAQSPVANCNSLSDAGSTNGLMPNGLDHASLHLANTHIVLDANNDHFLRLSSSTNNVNNSTYSVANSLDSSNSAVLNMSATDGQIRHQSSTTNQQQQQQQQQRQSSQINTTSSSNTRLSKSSADSAQEIAAGESRIFSNNKISVCSNGSVGSPRSDTSNRNSVGANEDVTRTTTSTTTSTTNIANNKSTARAKATASSGGGGTGGNAKRKDDKQTPLSSDGQRNSESPRRTFACPTCGKSFTEKFNMKRHMQIHSYERPKYACNECTKSFAWKDNFIRHKKAAHGGNIPQY